MATIINVGGGNKSVDYVEVGAVFSEHDRGYYSGFINLQTGEPTRLDEGEYIKFTRPANGQYSCVTKKACTVTYFQYDGAVITSTYGAGVTITTNYKLMLILVHKPE